ncbi:peroxiredoxin family protein [Flavobacterium sp.]|uniref:peroxiredoxin family protein n=1 Tax=Flavobacterium sp. TaxID=239 RepID=UPI00286C0F0A|nr:peroxiredoxin family protein [Flavobacterium sp.]
MRKIVLVFVMILIALNSNAQNGLKVGEKAPEFIGKDQNGKTIKLSDVLKKGKAVVVFYRGYWCPNCMRSLKNIQDSIAQMEQQNVTVIAVSPEKPEGVAKTTKIAKAGFSIISDDQLKILKDYKVAFEITPEMDAIHKKYNIDIEQNNGKKNANILPRPAAFIIGQDGIITYRYFNADPYSNPKSNERVTVAAILKNTK